MSNARKLPGPVRSLPFEQWPEADRSAWATACRPAERLKRGGPACHLGEVWRRDLVRRYGYFLDHLQRTERLDGDAGAAALVTPERVERYRAERQARDGSVTVHGSIYKLRRMAQLLAPRSDFDWLIEIEKDLELVMEPKSKFDRVIYTDVLVEAGMTLMAEADAATNSPALGRARQFRNGFMVALLAVHPLRLKNFAALEIGRSFVRIKDRWWIVLTAAETKEKRPDERRVVDYLASWIDRYLDVHRPGLTRTDNPPAPLWLSSNDGAPLTYCAVERIVSQTSLATIGVDVCPHLFRTSAASSCAAYAGDQPYLGAAVLHHSDPAVTNEHYNRACSMSATARYGDLIRASRR
jgi:integrase